MKKIIIFIFLLLAAKVQSFVPYITFGIDSGVALWNNDLGQTQIMNQYEQHLESLGWQHVKGVLTDDTSPIFFGTFVEMSVNRFIKVGAGFRYNEMGSQNIDVKGDYYDVNWVEYSESFQLEQFNPYLSLTFFKDIARNQSLNFKTEVGFTETNFEDDFFGQVWNPDYSSTYHNISAYGYSPCFSVTGSYEVKLFNCLILSAGVGYRNDVVQYLQISADETDNTYAFPNRQGDNVKNIDGSTFKMDLSGFLSQIKIGYNF